MPIEMLLGTTGAGKSYHAVNHYIPAIIADGRPVVTNLPLNLEAWAERYPDKAHLLHVVKSKEQIEVHLDSGYAEIADYAEGEAPEVSWGDAQITSDFEPENRPYLIIDEAATLYPKTKVRPLVQEFFRMHRHFGFDILLIVQNQTFIDPGVRKNVETTVRVSRMAAAGVKIPGFDYWAYHYVGETDNGHPEETFKYAYKDKGFELYKSRTMGGGAGKNQKKIGLVPLWLKGPLLMLYGAIGLSVFTLFYFDGYAIFRGPEKHFEPSGDPQEIVMTDMDGSGRRTGAREIVFVGHMQEAGQTVFMLSYKGRRPRAVDQAEMMRMGLNLSPADGCAAWLQHAEEVPTLVLCGDQL